MVKMRRNYDINVLFNEVNTMIRMNVFAIVFNDNGVLSGFNRQSEEIVKGNYVHQGYLLTTLLQVARLIPENYPVYFLTADGPIYDPQFQMDCIKLETILEKQLDSDSPITKESIKILQQTIEAEIPKIRGTFKLTLSKGIDQFTFSCYGRDVQCLVTAAFKLLKEQSIC